MKNILYILLFAAGLFLQCQPKQQTVDLPLPPINEEKMQAILTDIQIMEAWLSIKKVNQKDSTRHEFAVQYMEEILGIHEVSPQDFEESFNYYLHFPGKMSEFYVKMIDQLKGYGIHPAKKK